MKKVFSSFSELLDFDFSQLEPCCSNYLILEPNDGILPTVKKGYYFGKWRVISRSDSDSHPTMTIEITPRWVTITIYDGKSKRKEDFECVRQTPKALIQEIFES